MASTPLPVLDRSLPSPRLASEKVDALYESLRSYATDGAVVAFSGGVDSAFLIWAAERARRDVNGRVIALTTTSAATPDSDTEDAREVAKVMGVHHVWRASGELKDEAYTRNDGERCYHCKTELFRLAAEVAHEYDCRWILYGYTASDRNDVRPGHRAARERDVRAPLADCGLMKDEIRQLLRSEGFRIWDKPASPCLASRIATGVKVDEGKLGDVRSFERVLEDAGIRGARARICAADHGSFVRIEVDAGDIDRVLAVRDDLMRLGEARSYRWVTLDLAGYRTGGGTT